MLKSMNEAFARGSSNLSCVDGTYASLADIEMATIEFLNQHPEVDRVIKGVFTTVITPKSSTTLHYVYALGGYGFKPNWTFTSETLGWTDYTTGKEQMWTAASELLAILEDGSTEILKGCGCLHSVLVNARSGSCNGIMTFDLKVPNVEIRADRVNLEDKRVDITRDDIQSILLLTSASGSPETGALRVAVDVVVNGAFSKEVESMPESTMFKLKELVRSVGLKVSRSTDPFIQLGK